MSLTSSDLHNTGYFTEPADNPDFHHVSYCEWLDALDLPDVVDDREPDADQIARPYRDDEPRPWEMVRVCPGCAEPLADRDDDVCASRLVDCIERAKEQR